MQLLSNGVALSEISTYTPKQATALITLYAKSSGIKNSMFAVATRLGYHATEKVFSEYLNDCEEQIYG